MGRSAALPEHPDAFPALPEVPLSPQRPRVSVAAALNESISTSVSKSISKGPLLDGARLLLTQEELPLKIDTEALDQAVIDLTLQQMFFRQDERSVKEVMKHVIEKAHVLAGVEEQSVSFTLTRWLNVKLTPSIYVWNILLCAMSVVVPIGSFAPVAIGFFSAPDAWTTLDLGRVFMISSLANGFGALSWMRLARCCPLQLLWSISSLMQLTMLPILYTGIQPHFRSAFFVLVGIHGFGSGSLEPLFIGFNFATAWSADVRLAATRLSLVEPLRLFVSLGMIAGNLPCL